MGDIADWLVEIEMGFHPDFDTDGTYIGKSTRKHKPQNKVNGVESWILNNTKKSTKGDWQRLIYEIVEKYKVHNPAIKHKTRVGTFTNISDNFKEFKEWFKQTKQ